MKIAIRDTYREPGCRGGIGYYIIFLAQALNKIVDTLHIYTGEPEAFPGCETIQDRTIFNCTGLQRRFKLMKNMINPIRFDREYTCVIFPHPFEPLVHAPNSKRVFIVHDLIPLIIRGKSPRSYLDYLYFRYYLGYALRAVNKVVAVSDNTKADLVKNVQVPESQIDVIYNGFNYYLNNNLTKENSAEDTLSNKFGDYVLYLGNFLPHKNLKRLIQAISIVKNNIDINLLLVGWTSSNQYKNAAERYGIQNSVYFLGELSAERLARIIRGAKAFVYPSLYEGFGMPPLEAMSAGVPVAVSFSSSLPEVCGQAAVYFNPLDVGDMARAIQSILTDKVLRQRCIKNGFEQARLFDWKITAQKFAEMVAAL